MAMLSRSRLFFEPTNRKARASQYRTDARKAEVSGFPGFAEALWELAEWIDPTPREKPEPRRQRQPSRQQRNTSQQPRNAENYAVQKDPPNVGTIRNPNGTSNSGITHRGTPTPRRTNQSYVGARKNQPSNNNQHAHSRRSSAA